MKPAEQHPCQYSHAFVKTTPFPGFCFCLPGTHEKAFTRQRVLTFPVLISFLLCAFKGSLQTRLDDLFATLGGTALRIVTKSAVSQARQKLKASAFEALNDSLTGLLSELLPEPRWQGLRLVATDSTTLRLPPWPENQAEFGVQYDTSGQPCLSWHAPWGCSQQPPS